MDNIHCPICEEIVSPQHWGSPTVRFACKKCGWSIHVDEPEKNSQDNISPASME